MLDMFTEHLKQEWSVENLLFYVAVTEYEDRCARDTWASPQEQNQRALEIYFEFVIENADSQVSQALISPLRSKVCSCTNHVAFCRPEINCFANVFLPLHMAARSVKHGVRCFTYYVPAPGAEKASTRDYPKFVIEMVLARCDHASLVFPELYVTHACSSKNAFANSLYNAYVGVPRKQDQRAQES